MVIPACVRMPRVARWALLALGGVVLWSCPLSAQGEESAPAADSQVEERALTLEQLYAVAFEKSPLVAEITSLYTKDLAQAIGAELLDNPELQVEQTFTRMGMNGDDDPQSTATLAQPLRLSNFGQRQRVAAQLRRVGDQQRGMKLLELTQRLRLQFAALFTLQRSDALLADAEARATRKVELVHQGVRKGLLSAGDHALFEGEKFRLQAQRVGVQSALRTVQAELSRSLGVPWLVRAQGDTVLKPLPAEELLLSAARSGAFSPGLQNEALAALAAEQLKLAQLDAFPLFAPRLVYQHTNDGGDFFGVGVSVPLPVFNRNQAGMLRSEAELTAVQRKRAAFEGGGIEAQVRALRAAAASATAQARLFSQQVEPSYAEALRAQERVYAQGKGDVIQVWQMLRVYNEARAEGLTVWLGAVTARVQLSLLVGEEVQ